MFIQNLPFGTLEKYLHWAFFCESGKTLEMTSATTKRRKRLLGSSHAVVFPSIHSVPFNVRFCWLFSVKKFISPQMFYIKPNLSSVPHMQAVEINVLPLYLSI